MARPQLTPISFLEQSVPTPPAVGFLNLYADINGSIYIVDANGIRTNLGDVMSNLTLEEILKELRRIALALELLIGEQISYDDAEVAALGG